MNMKRILNIIRTMDMGGAQVMIMNIYRNIDKTKIQFDFLVNEKGFFDKEILKMGGKIFYMPYITDIGQYLYSRKLQQFFKEHTEYTIVHSHINQVSGIILESAHKANVPIRIAHAHSSNNKNHIIAKIYKKYLQNKINANATQLFACSKDAANWLFTKRADEAIILKNGINIEDFQFSEQKRKEIREKYNVKKNTTIIGNVARFEEVKNHIFLLQIFNEYQKINDNSVLMLVGEGKTKEKIQKEAKELNIENKVYFISNQKEISKYYCAFDYFVFPSQFEGLGIVLIEAQISGLKCFASDKVIPKETKITELIKYIDLDNSAKIWASQIPTNNQYERKIVNNEEFNITTIAKKMEKFYLESVR